jgi:hypothetical protein
METRSKIPAMSRRKFGSPWLDGPIKATEVAVCCARGAIYLVEGPRSSDHGPITTGNPGNIG